MGCRCFTGNTTYSTLSDLLITDNAFYTIQVPRFDPRPEELLKKCKSTSIDITHITSLNVSRLPRARYQSPPKPILNLEQPRVSDKECDSPKSLVDDQKSLPPRRKKQFDELIRKRQEEKKEESLVRLNNSLKSCNQSQNSSRGRYNQSLDHFISISQSQKEKKKLRHLHDGPRGRRRSTTRKGFLNPIA